MSTDPSRPRLSVFLSYASQDRTAAQSLRDALIDCGLDVLYDESSLVGGDAWDQKIRRQIRECDFFMPVISSNTEARAEGYFRREWRLAVERTLDMADDHIFLLPVVIDDTSEAHARVPERFFTVQWLRVPRGERSAALEALCARLLSGQPVAKPQAAKAARAAQAVNELTAEERSTENRSRSSPPVRAYPPFPREEPGQRTRFWLQVLGWMFRWLWVSFTRLPQWVRICAYVWLAVALLAQLDHHSERTGRAASSNDSDSDEVSAADAAKIKSLADSYQGSGHKADIVKFAGQIAREFSDAAGDSSSSNTPLLAVPFSAPPGDAAAEKLIDATFAQMYGRIAVSRRGRVGLTSDAPASVDAATAVAQGRAHGASYVIYGTVGRSATAQTLTVSLLEVDDGSVAWSKSYPLAGADPAGIAADVDANVAKLDLD